jgi:hypothetical protein
MESTELQNSLASLIDPVFTYWRYISIVAELTESPVKKEAYITSSHFVEYAVYHIENTSNRLEDMDLVKKKVKLSL